MATTHGDDDETDHYNQTDPFGVAGVAALIPCPFCAGHSWTHRLGTGLWCDACNARMTVETTTGDPGCVARVSAAHVREDQTFTLPPDGAEYAVKVMGQPPRGVYWTAVFPPDSTDREARNECEAWEPAARPTRTE